MNDNYLPDEVLKATEEKDYKIQAYIKILDATGTVGFSSYKELIRCIVYLKKIQAPVLYNKEKMLIWTKNVGTSLSYQLSK
jgi:hypothetical protein